MRKTSFGQSEYELYVHAKRAASVSLIAVTITVIAALHVGVQVPASTVARYPVGT